MYIFAKEPHERIGAGAEDEILEVNLQDLIKEIK
jgi:hypothetical protein